MTYVPMGKESFEKSIEKLVGDFLYLLIKLYGSGIRLFRDDYVELDIRDGLTIRSNLVYTECVDGVVNARSDREFQVVLREGGEEPSFVEPGEWVFYLYRLNDQLKERAKERKILDEYRFYYS